MIYVRIMYVPNYDDDENRRKQVSPTTPLRTARPWRRAAAPATGRRPKPSSSRWRAPIPTLSAPPGAAAAAAAALLLPPVTRARHRWPRPRFTATRSSGRTEGASGACVLLHPLCAFFFFCSPSAQVFSLAFCWCALDRVRALRAVWCTAVMGDSMCLPRRSPAAPGQVGFHMVVQRH